MKQKHFRTASKPSSPVILEDISLIRKMPLLIKYIVLLEDYKMHEMIFNGLEYNHCNIIKYCGFFFFLKGVRYWLLGRWLDELSKP